ncbi:hypothetical protein D3C85_1147950 [compost metagenome]
MQKNYGQEQDAKRPQGRCAIGDQPHFFRRRQVHGEVEGAGQHEEKLAGIGGLILVTLPRSVRELTSGHERTKRGRDGLQRDLTDG